MKPWMIAACAGLATSLFLAQPAIAGDVNPPPGGIKGTMKPLDQIEPRVSVNSLPGDQSSTHTITQPGLYVFTGDVTGENGKDGLRVDLDALPPGDYHVAIDLQGYSLSGVAGAANAIFVTNNDPDNRRLHITISGSVRDMPGNAPGSLITGWSVDGVHVEGATSCTVEGVRVSECVGDGFEFSNPPLAGVDVRCFRCVFSHGGADGVTVTLPGGGSNSLEIQEVRSLSNVGSGARVQYAADPSNTKGSTRVRLQDDTMSSDDDDGFSMLIDKHHSVHASMSGVRCSNNGGNGMRISVDDDDSDAESFVMDACSSSGNAGSGFSFVVLKDTATSSSSLRFSSCSSSGNGVDGFRCDVASTAAGTVRRCSWDACVSSSNTGNGFTMRGALTSSVHSSMRRCSSLRNDGHGFEEHSNEASVDDFVSSGNGGSGLSSTNTNLRCSTITCSNNTLYGVDYSDPDDDNDASMDGLRCAGNGSGGAIWVGGATLRVSSSMCVGNGGGGGGGGCGFECSSVLVSSFRDLRCAQNFSHGLYTSQCGSVRAHSVSMDENGRGPVGGDGVRSSRDQSADFVDLRCSSNTGNGLSCADLTGDGRLDVVVCRDNAGDGVRLSDYGLSRVVSLSRCVCSSNAGDGVNVTTDIGAACGKAVLDACVCSSNTGSGIDLSATTGGTVRRCETSSNGGTGIIVSGNGHVVLGNIVSDNSGGPISCPVPGNTLGPMVDEPGVTQNCNPAANYVR